MWERTMRLQYQTRLFVSAMILIVVLITAGQITHFSLAQSNMRDSLVAQNRQVLIHNHSLYRRIMDDASDQMDKMASDSYLNYEVRKLDDLSLGSGTKEEIDEQCNVILNQLRGNLATMDIYVVTSQRILRLSMENGVIKKQLYAMEFGTFFSLGSEEFAEGYNNIVDKDSMLDAEDARSAMLRELPAEGCYLVGIIPVEKALSMMNTKMAVYTKDGQLSLLLNMDLPPYTMTGETLNQGDNYKKMLYRGEKITMTYYDDPVSGDRCVGVLDDSVFQKALQVALQRGVIASVFILLVSILIYYRWASAIMAPLDMFRHIVDTSFDISNIKRIDFEDYFPSGSYNIRVRLYGYFMSIVIPLTLSLVISYGFVSDQSIDRLSYHEQSMRYQLALEADMSLMEGYRLGYRIANDPAINQVLIENIMEHQAIILGNDDKNKISHILLNHTYFGQALKQVVILNNEMNTLYRSNAHRDTLALDSTHGTPFWQIADGDRLLWQQNISQLIDQGDGTYLDEVKGRMVLTYSQSLFNDVVLGSEEVYILDSIGGILPLQSRGKYTNDVSSFMNRSLSAGNSFEVTKEDVRLQVHVMEMYQKGWRVLTVSPKQRGIWFQTVIQQGWIYLILLSACLLIALILGALATETILRPIRRLRTAISVDDVQARLDETLYGRNEFSILAKRYNKMMDRLNVYAQSLQKEEQQRHQLENRRREAEIIALQTQINPHFLYNIFTSIAVLIRSGRTDEAAQMVMDTGNLMRLGVYRGSLMVPLSEEISHVEHYMKLQRIRYLHRVDLHIDCDEELCNHKVVKFILQPVVENAIEHGLEDEESHLDIHIHAYRQDESLYIEVEDDGVGIDEIALRERQKMLDSFRRVSQLGLLNVHERIRLNCGKAYGIELKKSQLGGLKVILHLPAKP